jgi:DNA-binding MarR family transcriptional regulator
MRRLPDAEWEPTVPALLQLVAATGGPRLRAAFAAAGLDGLRPAQSVALVPLAAGGLHASNLADRIGVSRQAVAQAVAALERHSYVNRVPNPDDARARIIELTPRGRQALRVMRSNAVDLEKRWQQILGQRRLG